MPYTCEYSLKMDTNSPPVQQPVIILWATGTSLHMFSHAHVVNLTFLVSKWWQKEESLLISILHALCQSLVCQNVWRTITCLVIACTTFKIRFCLFLWGFLRTEHFRYCYLLHPRIRLRLCCQGEGQIKLTKDNSDRKVEEYLFPHILPF